MGDFDAVVAGGGPNGLAAALRLAEAGWSVCVVEANQDVGGAARTIECTLPGFRHDLGAGFWPWRWSHRRSPAVTWPPSGCGSGMRRFRPPTRCPAAGGSPRAGRRTSGSPIVASACGPAGPPRGMDRRRSRRRSAPGPRPAAAHSRRERQPNPAADRHPEDPHGLVEDDHRPAIRHRSMAARQSRSATPASSRAAGGWRRGVGTARGHRTASPLRPADADRPLPAAAARPRGRRPRAGPPAAAATGCRAVPG
jgi:choline dehydrogenase-like flavoprotein